MPEDLNPQGPQMADESMVRNLLAQATCIWPQEEPFFARYGLEGDIDILDAGCGTGDVSWRLARMYPHARVLGIDIIESHLELARTRHAGFGERLRFEVRDIFDLRLPERSFDLVVCRHVIQAVPHADRVIAELARVTRRGGRLHVIAEDYGMMAFPPRSLDPDDFWSVAPRDFGTSLGTDMRVGRRAFSLMRAAGLHDVRIDYVVVDTLRAPREAFATIWESWRDGYCAAIGEHTRISESEARAHFDDMIATIRDPESYAAWFVPVASAVVP